MKFANEFTVAAPLDETWRTLLDVERTAGCLPGARVEPTDDDGVYSGQMRVKLGAVTTDYSGTARVSEVDEDARVAVFDVSGSETRGQGSASATIVNRLSETGEGTLVRVETDLNISGRAAQFGRGLMADVAERMLKEFAGGLEAEILRGGAPAGEARPPRAEPPEAFDVGVVVWLPVAKRVAAVAAVVGAGVLATAAVTRQRKGRRPRLHFEFDVRL